MVLRKKQYAPSCIGWATLIRVNDKIEFVNLTEGFKYKFNLSGMRDGKLVKISWLLIIVNSSENVEKDKKIIA